jgi:hypothetical protein
VDWQPVETGGTGRGIPDVNYCFEGREGWVENKIAQGAKGLRFALRPEQIGWIERRARNKGRVFIAVRREVEKSLIDQLWLFGPEHARCTVLDDKALPARGVWSGGPRNWNWDEFLAHLIA